MTANPDSIPQQIRDYRCRAVSIGLDESDTARFREIASRPRVTEAQLAELSAKAAAPLQTPSALRRFINGR